MAKSKTVSELYAEHVAFKREVKIFERTINPKLAEIGKPAIDYWYECKDVKKEIEFKIQNYGAKDGALNYFIMKYGDAA